MDGDFMPGADCTDSDSNSSIDCNPTLALPSNACVCELAATQFTPQYAAFNLILIVIILPAVAIFGVITNALALFVYTRSHMLRSTTNFYLAALAVSDIFVDICGISSIAIDSARRFDPFLNEIHLAIIPYTLPLCYIAQMCSVYFTVLAAFDCYLTVCQHGQTTSLIKNRNRRNICSRSTVMAKIYVISVVSASFLYNGITFADLHVVECVDYSRPDSPNVLKKEICPTDLRVDPVYGQIYKVYMYAIFMTFLPFSVLLTLNCLIIWKLYREPAADKKAVVITQCDSISSDIDKTANEDVSANESTIMLVMVVALFLVCNSIALVVNIIETFGNYPMEDPDAANRLFFVIDVGNFLVVFNSSANFLIYYAFSKAFRAVLTRNRRKLLGRFAASLTSLGTQYYLANSSFKLNDDTDGGGEAQQQNQRPKQKSSFVENALKGLTDVAASIAVTPQTPPQANRRAKTSSSRTTELLSIKRVSPATIVTANYHQTRSKHCEKTQQRPTSLGVPTIV